MATPEQLINSVNMVRDADFSGSPRLHTYSKDGESFIEKADDVPFTVGLSQELLVPQYVSIPLVERNVSRTHFSCDPDVFNYVAAFD